MSSARLTSCCGLGEIANLSYPYDQTFEQQLKGALRNKKVIVRRSYYDYHNGASRSYTYSLFKGALFFTSNTNERDNYAEQFAEGLRKNKLGKVTKLPAFKNPNTTNPITVYMWVIDKDRLIAFIKKQGWEQCMTAN